VLQIHIKPIRLLSNYMLILCSMRTNRHQQDALLKNPVALKVLVWSRGLLVTLHTLTSSSFSLVEENLGQCISSSLIDVESGFTAYVVFLFFSFLSQLSWPCRKPGFDAAVSQCEYHCQDLCVRSFFILPVVTTAAVFARLFHYIIFTRKHMHSSPSSLGGA